MWNVGTFGPDANGEAQVVVPQGESTDAGQRGGIARSSDEVLETGWSEGAVARAPMLSDNQRWDDLVISVQPERHVETRVHWFLDRSRMNREVHVRFWESAEVRFLRATHHYEL